jgi:predicted nucleic acid-binding protein
MAVLIDTNFLLAATYAKDENHAKAQITPMLPLWRSRSA